ncbi:MAG: hypothetical protein D3906_17645, partial [Candidatus Electrothrix sp. AUS1_2]|nr:hypothetical protein [Candidatus Electrothrix sp. AUS1_2]
GTACVYHQGKPIVYKLEENLPVFTGDTLLTGEKSGLTLKMPDDSILVLAAQTKLTIDRAMLRMNVRDTVLQLFFGRIRALVKKLSGKYTVWTPTVFLGVRGTDFAMAAAPAPFDRSDDELLKKKRPAEFLTAVLTGGDQSTIELKGRSGPPIIMKPLSVAGVQGESRAGEAVYVGSAAQDLLRRIAPLPDVRPDFPPMTVPSHRPCLPFSEKIRPDRLKFFRVCE